MKWGNTFEKIISKCSEAEVYMHNSWWNIYEFELDSGLFKIDVIGQTQICHCDDIMRIKVDGIEYSLDDIYN